MTDIVNTPEFLGSVFYKYAGVPVVALSADEYEVMSHSMIHGIIDYFRKEALMSDEAIQDELLHLAAIGYGACQQMNKQAAEAPSSGWSDWTNYIPIKHIAKGVANSATSAGEWGVNNIAKPLLKPIISPIAKKVEESGKRIANSTLDHGADLALKHKDEIKAVIDSHGDAQGRGAVNQIWDNIGSTFNKAKEWMSNPENLKTLAPYAIGGLGLFGAAKLMGAGTGTALALGAGGALAAPHIAKGFSEWNEKRTIPHKNIIEDIRNDKDVSDDELIKRNDANLEHAQGYARNSTLSGTGGN